MAAFQKSNSNSRNSEILREIYKKVSEEFDLTPNIIEEAYNSQYKYCKNEIQSTWDKFRLGGKHNYDFSISFPTLQIIGLAKLIPSPRKYKIARSKMNEFKHERNEESTKNN